MLGCCDPFPNRLCLHGSGYTSGQNCKLSSEKEEMRGNAERNIAFVHFFPLLRKTDT